MVTRLTLAAFSLVTMLVIAALVCGRVFVSSAGLLAFTSDLSGNWEIYLMDVEHTILYNLTNHPADDFTPAWSPLAQQLTFYSDRDGDGNAEIYLMDLNENIAEPLMMGSGNYWQPYWSPDGQQIVFIRNYGNIRIMDIDGTNERGLTYGFGPVWSPTEARIAYYADHPGDLNADIYIIDADGRNLRNLTQDAVHDWDPSWSPDGRQLAFVSSRAGNAELYVMDASCERLCGTNARRLTNNPATDRAPAWSVDGQFIAFESEVDGVAQINVMRLDGTQVRQLVSGRSPVWLDLR